MTINEIRNYVIRLSHKRYSSGVIVMHIVAPEWLEDLKWCIKAINFLLDELSGEGK